MYVEKFHPARGARRRSAGLTLTELLVTTAILAIIVGLTGGMLSQTQRVIRRTKLAIKANANARAVADRLRTDIQGILQDGFLIIMNDLKGGPRLAFLTSGCYRSMCDDGVYANAARVEYGLRVYEQDNPADNIGTLYRRAVLQNPKDTVRYANDHEKMSLSYYHFAPQCATESMSEWMYSPGKTPNPHENKYHDFAKPFPGGVNSLPRMLNDPWDDAVSCIQPVTYPINTLDDVRNLWPFMLTGVTEMSILWTDGSVDATTGRLNWYGIQRKGGTQNALYRYDKPRRGDWTRTAPGWRYGRRNRNLEYRPESNLSMLTRMPPPVYNAFWAFDRKDLWPRGIRVQFQVGTGPQAQSHDIIVALPDMHQEP